MLLLEAIDNSGFGNWENVADHVGTKSKKECKVRSQLLLLRSIGKATLHLFRNAVMM